MSRVSNLKKDFSRILRKWKDALDEPKSEFSRDAAILRFELAYEVGWKLLQKLVRKEGYDAETPRHAFQRAFEIGWTQDEEIWYDVIEARNKATHVYREEYADELYDELENYYQAFKELAENIV